MNIEKTVVHFDVLHVAFPESFAIPVLLLEFQIS